MVYQFGYHLLYLQEIKIIGYGDCKRKRFQSQPDEYSDQGTEGGVGTSFLPNRYVQDYSGYGGRFLDNPDMQGAGAGKDDRGGQTSTQDYSGYAR